MKKKAVEVADLEKGDDKDSTGSQMCWEEHNALADARWDMGMFYHLLAL